MNPENSMTKAGRLQVWKLEKGEQRMKQVTSILKRLWLPETINKKKVRIDEDR